MRVTPNDFVAYVSTVVGMAIGGLSLMFPSSYHLGLVIFTLSSISLAALIFNQIWPQPLEAFVGRMRHGRSPSFATGLIPFPQAARELYEACLHTGVGTNARFDWGRGADPLEYCGYLLARRGLAIYGRRPPSRVFETVPPERFTAGGLSDGAQNIVRDGFDDFYDLSVRRSEFRAVMAAIVKGEGSVQ